MRFEEILVSATAITGLVCLANLAYKKRNMLTEYSRSFFPILLIVLVLRSFLYEPFRIPSGSMLPTLLIGDFILVNKYAYGVRLPITGTKLIPVGEPQVGDIVVFRHTGDMDLIKRVVGVPGDHIQYVNKQLYRNGELVEIKDGIEKLGNILHPTNVTPPNQLEYFPYADVIVPPNSYFVMGDNRGNSKDSRYWGFVPEKDLLGKMVATLISWDSNGSGLNHIRWDRTGKSIYKYAS